MADDGLPLGKTLRREAGDQEQRHRNQGQRLDGQNETATRLSHPSTSQRPAAVNEGLLPTK